MRPMGMSEVIFIRILHRDPCSRIVARCNRRTIPHKYTKIDRGFSIYEYLILMELGAFPRGGVGCRDTFIHR